jgi:hypothetical protein
MEVDQDGQAELLSPCYRLDQVGVLICYQCGVKRGDEERSAHLTGNVWLVI